MPELLSKTKWHVFLAHCVCVLCTELHDAIFVIGALDEMLMLRGMRYHPIDIENSIVRSHRNICEWLVNRHC